MFSLCLFISSYISLSLYPSSETLNSIDASDIFTHCSSVEYIHSLYVCPWAWAYHFIKLIQFAVCFSFSAVSISFTQFLVSSVCCRCHLFTIHHRCPWLWLIQCKCFFLYISLTLWWAAVLMMCTLIQIRCRSHRLLCTIAIPVHFAEIALHLTINENAFFVLSFNSTAEASFG